ncbi:hypothetical protein H2198_006342 [Neophaeococcomyces mojaviensis]|uniref:Uncharacterized protein n=1 Tax=Neophaeococcomyces mojaviensis TaxID=3383035 RepID=A0ACC3A3B9_9EURO|nr:hypothetical protein H2198_006342 [Knufia sp. JES_112]
MPPSFESSLFKALSLSSETTQLSRHGSSGFTSTYKLTTDSTTLFVKTSATASAAVMFEGEHASLNAINSAVPSLSPKSLAWGKLDDGGGYFLCVEFVDMSARSVSGGGKGSGLSLAHKLAKLHSTPIPEEFHGKGFGFPVSTCCGNTTQNNSFKSSWAEFFGQNRLLNILEQAESNNGQDAKLRALVNETIGKVVPRLLGDGHLGGVKGIEPVVCHGDLWSGNKGKGVFPSRSDSAVEDLVFDPSAVYGHSEYDHGIMNMFGGFSSSFWKEYFSHVPKTEPVEEYEDRIALYESYHHLNHYNMFGGSYKSGALSLLEPLVKKYG